MSEMMIELLAIVLVALFLSALYGLWTTVIRFSHHKMRGCDRHGQEADLRAAITQTALTLRFAGLVALSVLAVMLPETLTRGWLGLVLGVAAGGLLALATSRWRSRRERTHGLVGRCRKSVV